MTALYSFKVISLKTVTLVSLIILLGTLSSGVYALPLESDDKRYMDNGDGTITAEELPATAGVSSFLHVDGACAQRLGAG